MRYVALQVARSMYYDGTIYYIYYTNKGKDASSFLIGYFLKIVVSDSLKNLPVGSIYRNYFTILSLTRVRGVAADGIHLYYEVLYIHTNTHPYRTYFVYTYSEYTHIVHRILETDSRHGL